jgi:hypothetical protein
MLGHRLSVAAAVDATLQGPGSTRENAEACQHEATAVSWDLLTAMMRGCHLEVGPGSGGPRPCELGS